jgi:hypothetical protein
MLAVIGSVATLCGDRAYNASAEREHEMILQVRGLRVMIAARGGVSPGLNSPTAYWLLFW